MDIIQKISLMIFVAYWIGFGLICHLFETPPLKLSHWVYKYTRGGLVVAGVCAFVFISDLIWTYL